MRELINIKRLWVLFTLLCSSQICLAIDVDPTFTAAKFEGYGGQVFSVAVQADGKSILVGDFDSWDGVNRANIVRLQANGEVDSSFNASTDLVVFDVAIQADGKILIVGEFRSVNGVSQAYLARLNQDGSLDTSLNHEITGTVLKVVVDGVGRILVGGRIWAGASYSAIRRLNTNGAFDTTFSFSHNIQVSSIAIQSDNKILIGGSFTNLGNSNVSGIARLNLDGSVDSGFTSNVMHSSSAINVTNIGVRSDGKIFIAGTFSHVDGLARGNVARLNSDGSVDTDFISSTDSFVNALIVDNQGRAVIGGRFRKVGDSTGTALHPIAIARLGNDGQTDDGFQVYRKRVMISALAIQKDGKLVATTLRPVIPSNKPISQIVRLNPSGSIDELFLSSGEMTTSTGGRINAISVQNDEKIVVAGSFARINQQQVKHITRLNNDGSLDSSFLPPSIPDAVRGVAIQEDNKILLWNVSHLYRLHPDGSLDEGFNAAINNITQIAIQNDGRILVVGSFISANGSFLRKYIVRINGDGTTDESFQVVSVSSAPTTVAIQKNGKIVISGSFDTVNGVVRNRLARLNVDGSLDSSFSPSLDRPARKISVLSDQSILLSGHFTSVNGTPANGLVKLNSLGQIDEAYMNELDWPSNPVTVFDMAIQCDGKTVAITSLNSPEDRLLRNNQDGSKDTSFTHSLELHNGRIAIQNDGKIILSTQSSASAIYARFGLARYIDSANEDAQCYQSQKEFCLPIKVKNGSVAVICL